MANSRLRAPVFMAVLMAATLASPVLAECTIPNAIANGQVADASKVMDNFTAIANCVDSGVKPSGTPQVGEIAVFSGGQLVTGGNLSGDVTTSGGTTTTLSATGVTPGTYISPIVSIDAKGRITSAASGTGGGVGGGASWEVIHNIAITSAIANLDFDISPYSEVQVLFYKVTSSASGRRALRVSTDGGTTFFSGAADYEYVTPAGVLGVTPIVVAHQTSNAAARTAFVHMFGTNISGTIKQMRSQDVNPTWLFVANTLPITHIRILNESGNMTGGSVIIMVK